MRRDFAIIALLFALPLLLFWQQTIGGMTLIPTENLYQFEPFATYRDVVRAPETPHNALLSDLVLQNFQWKTFIREQMSNGEIPLWNPHQFAGIPFMAAGQQSTLYPLSILYYVLPLTAAYGWFTVANLWLAGVFMYLFARGLGVSRFGGAISGVTYQLAGMFIASAVHPMIVGAVVWLPLMLLMIEFIIRQRPVFGQTTSVPWVAIGALALACNILAGHPEITIYSLLISGYYAGMRLLIQLWTQRTQTGLVKGTLTRAVWLLTMVILGLGLGAVQLVPLFDFVQTNWRAERSDLATVLSYAHSPRNIVQFLLPNFYGNPAHHAYFDLFSWQNVEVGFVNALGEFRTHTDWGTKNYVEGALYVGILPLILAAFGFVSRQRLTYKLIFALLAVISLSFAFGLPTYALVYGLPGINQLNTAFRWIYGVTFCVAILAGFGADALVSHRLAARRAGFALILAGVVIMAGLLISRLLYPQLEPLITDVIAGLARANEAFSDARMFYSYQFVNVAIFAVMLLGAGIVFLWVRGDEAKVTPGRVLAVLLVGVDLMIASWGFNPASDAALLDFTPPSVEWLQGQSGEWRYVVLNGEGRDILPANVGMRYGLDEVTGYESIISAQYVDYMRETLPQTLLDFNRVAPLATWMDYAAIIESPRFRLLNVRYIVTHPATELASPVLTPVYEDAAVRIWENTNLVPRAYTVADVDAWESPITEAEIVRSSGRELFIRVENAAPTWLIVSQTYAPGWRAFIRPEGAEESAEDALPVELVRENFQGVYLPESGAWTVRLIYSPTSFQVGAFGSIISAAILVFVVGLWLWRVFIGRGETTNSTQVSRLARNSIAPIMLNLFNRVIDFVFAAIMLRVLGPEDAGWYYYAIAVFMWFDILTNFGLDVFLMREAARSRERAGYFFYNTSILRLFLVALSIPLLLGFVTLRQGAVDPPLSPEVLLTIALFYIGLIPGSLSKGITSLFYVFERAEYPAAVTTVTTISRVIFGLIALLLGYGIVGLAAVSIVTNLITLAVLLYNGRGLIGRIPIKRPDIPLIRSMTGTSWTLMLNHFLATIFFQIDIVLLEWIRDARTVGLYRVAYSWLLAINVIPAMFTQALLPIMSRQAREDRAAFRRTYMLSIKLLVSVALPFAVAFTFMAEPLTWLLGGSAYLPDGAVALQLMIWSIPIGWMNSLTQYVLIALDLQRRITRAFLLAVTFNIVSNLILIPTYGYRAAALTTIASEVVLWLPFVLLLQAEIGRLPWLAMLWRPIVAAGVMFGILAIGWQAQPFLALMFASVAYPVVLLGLRPLSREEWGMLSPLFPARLKRLTGTA